MPYRIVDCDLDDTYRYSLTVNTDHSSKMRLVVIQCNPSVANREGSDPTVGKVSVWAEEYGFSEVVFLNLFSYISPYTYDLINEEYSYLVGPRNNEVLRNYINSDSTIVLAWGRDVPVGESHYYKRIKKIKSILDDAGVVPHKVGALSYGTHPRHGRMWNKGNREISVLRWSEIIA